MNTSRKFNFVKLPVWFMTILALEVLVGVYICIPHLAHGPVYGDPLAVEKPEVITLGFVGDIMMHGTQIKNGYNPTTKSYTFDGYFDALRTQFRGYDLMIGNLETPIAGSAVGYGAYPLFNAPDEVVAALVRAGFDGVQVANNHAYDRGVTGARHTIATLRANNLTTIGTSPDTTIPSPTMMTVRGITIGMVSGTYGFNVGGNPSGEPGLIHRLDTANIIQQIHTARDNGADIVIVMPHWGTEYQRTESTAQQQLAANWIDAGTNLVVGSHPHVVQPMRTMTTAAGATGIVAYSLGNFVSNQQDLYTDLGGLLSVTITRANPSSPAVITDHTFEYLYTHKDTTSNLGRVTYRVLPLATAATDPLLTPAQLQRIQKYLLLDTFNAVH